MSTKTKNIHKSGAAKPKPNAKKAIRQAKEAIEAKPTVAAKVWAAVKKAAPTAKVATNKTIGVTYSAGWRTAVAGIAVPLATAYINGFTEAAHNAISKGAQYGSTLKGAFIGTLDLLHPVTNTVADHPVISTAVVAATWIVHKFTKETK